MSPTGPPSVPTAPAGQPAIMPVSAMRGYTRTRLLWIILLIAGPAVAVIGVVVYLGQQLGPAALGIGLAGAILPVPAVVACFLWLDRYQPLPLWLIAVCFLWGAGVAASGALFVNDTVARLITDHDGDLRWLQVLGAPLTEELLKAGFPILLYLVYRRAFSGITDGIVFCGLSAAGFAMVENIVYLGGYGWASQSPKGYATGAFAVTTTFILRVPMAGFAHPLFTAMTGIGLGIGARSPRRVVRIAAPLVGLLGAVLLHASWNSMALLAQDDRSVLLYGYFAVFMPIFFVAVGFVLWIRSLEGRRAERILPLYAAAGWFSPPEVTALGTMGRRLSARTWATRVAGDAGNTAMRAYQFAATRLAVVRDGLNRGLYRKAKDVDRALAEERRLLDAVDAYRRVFVGRDPLTPPAWWSDGAYRIRFPDGVVHTVAAPALPVVPVPVPAAWATPPPPHL